jgi:hypothetical protein
MKCNVNIKFYIHSIFYYFIIIIILQFYMKYNVNIKFYIHIFTHVLCNLI